MKHLKLCLLLFAMANIFASCTKDKQSEDQLPPATQTGAGTFGCKINGKVYVPKGSSGTGRPNPHIQYDYDLNGNPYLSIETFQYPTSNKTGLLIAFRNLAIIGYYPVSDSFRFDFGWPDVIQNCGNSSSDINVLKWGGGNITKLDITNRIISGTFDFKVKNTTCDTVYITNGRFDIKF